MELTYNFTIFIDVKIIKRAKVVTETTKGISVSVETSYQPGYSSPSQYHYVFTYNIRIENTGSHTVQLLRRSWNIHDAGHAIRKVDGDGVVGQQPVIEPGESHEYVSGCTLKSGIGKMWGHYEVERIMDGKVLKIRIPEFQMTAPFKLN